MKYLEVTMAIIGLLLLAVVDLIRMVRGKQTVDEEWHNDYMDQGQGRNNHG